MDGQRIPGDIPRLLVKSLLEPENALCYHCDPMRDESIVNTIGIRCRPMLRGRMYYGHLGSQYIDIRTVKNLRAVCKKFRDSISIETIFKLGTYTAKYGEYYFVSVRCNTAYQTICFRRSHLSWLIRMNSHFGRGWLSRERALQDWERCIDRYHDSDLMNWIQLMIPLVDDEPEIINAVWFHYPWWEEEIRTIQEQTAEGWFDYIDNVLICKLNSRRRIRSGFKVWDELMNRHKDEDARYLSLLTYMHNKVIESQRQRDEFEQNVISNLKLVKYHSKEKKNPKKYNRQKKVKQPKMKWQSRNPGCHKQKRR